MRAETVAEYVARGGVVRRYPAVDPDEEAVDDPEVDHPDGEEADVVTVDLAPSPVRLFGGRSRLTPVEVLCLTILEEAGPLTVRATATEWVKRHGRPLVSPTNSAATVLTRLRAMGLAQRTGPRPAVWSITQDGSAALATLRVEVER